MRCMLAVVGRTAKSITTALAAIATLAFAAPALAQAGEEPAVAVETPIDPAAVRRAAMSEAFGKESLRNGEFLWKDGTTAVDRLFLSLNEQMIYAYASEELVGVSTVSTGRHGHETRPGSFSILAKHRYYYSKKYDNAPMPYMQLITTYGVALHAGPMPGYPASHGCIRLPTQFAANLFVTTRIGIPVRVAE